MKRCLRIGLPLILVCLFLFPGSGFAKEIKVLSQFPMSGPVGSLPEFGWGYIDGMNWVNSEEGGGVNGKKITWYLEDFRYDPTVEVANFNRYAAEHSPDEFILATGYITGGLNWKCDYIAVINKAHTAVDFSGWVTITNRSTPATCAGIAFIARVDG